jgi:hypothetical protein
MRQLLQEKGNIIIIEIIKCNTNNILELLQIDLFFYIKRTFHQQYSGI